MKTRKARAFKYGNLIENINLYVCLWYGGISHEPYEHKIIWISMRMYNN